MFENMLMILFLKKPFSNRYLKPFEAIFCCKVMSEKKSFKSQNEMGFTW